MDHAGKIQKTLYVLPGFGESTQDKPYRQIARFAKTVGYDVVMYSPKWSRSTPSDWIAGFRAQLPEKPVGQAIVFGFSFGAHVAINAAKTFPFDRIIACSLPPFFKGDIKDIDADTRAFLGKRRMEDLARYPFPARLGTRITLMNGAEEDAEDIVKSDRYFKKWTGEKKRILVDSAEHDLETGDYLKAIKSELA